MTDISPAGHPALTAPVPVLLALGSNLGDPPRRLAAAVEKLRDLMDVEAASALYLTEPIGIREQPDFHNLVVRGTTGLPVHALHAGLHRIERELGRQRVVRNGPRIIDIDLLAYGELVLVSPTLTVPHPRMTERAFVLVPLAEVAPGWRHPGLDRSASECLALLASAGGVHRLGPLAGFAPHPATGARDGSE
jgi:2-amino-4-hydroxy-6-hydroxymethyldihydropteridine diphosphokinase